MCLASPLIGMWPKIDRPTLKHNNREWIDFAARPKLISFISGDLEKVTTVAYEKENERAVARKNSILFRVGTAG